MTLKKDFYPVFIVSSIAPTQSPNRPNPIYIQHREDKFEEGHNIDGFVEPHNPPYFEVDSEAEMKENSEDIPTRSEAAPVLIQNTTGNDKSNKEDKTTTVNDNIGSFVDISDSERENCRGISVK